VLGGLEGDQGRGRCHPNLVSSTAGFHVDDIHDFLEAAFNFFQFPLSLRDSHISFGLYQWSLPLTPSVGRCLFVWPEYPFGFC